MKKVVFSFFLLCFSGVVSSHAADIKAGKEAAVQCNVCHGKDGLSVNPEAPNLAGEADVYLQKQLTDFKSGARQHRIMSIIAQGLEDEDIKNLAAWYAAMKVTVELPDVE